MRLNEEQLSAVKTIEGPVLILAGAGSGKTRVVTTRIAEMVRQGIPPDQILGLTFTNKAAGEMAERVKILSDQRVLISTFHSLGVRILRESIHHIGYSSKFTIYDEDDSLRLLKACLDELQLDEKKYPAKEFRHRISLKKNGMASFENQKGNWNSESDFSEVFALYQMRLKECHAVDFDDLLTLTVELLRDFPDLLAHYQNRWRYILVDEYQDTNQAQYEMMKLLAGARQNICVVGDPDQSIYSWRGASISNILNFERDYPGAVVFRLEQNYRSHMNILDAANALISHNESRLEKNLWSDLGEGEKIQVYQAYDGKDEARYVADRIRYHAIHDGIPYSEMVVFYRTNSQSRIFEDYLYDRNIPYVIVGGLSFYQRREIKDVLAFLRLLQTGSDYVSFARTINLPKRGIGAATIEKIWHGARERELSILDFCRQALCQSGFIRLSAKQKEGLTSYLGIIDQLLEWRESVPLYQLITRTINETGYYQTLNEDPETASDRKENLNELISKAKDWEESHENPSLDAFLEEMALKSNLDEADSSQDRLNLMTIHNGKGLEFPIVFLVGLEEDLFPHVNSRNSESALEEERRLCYVGITRAKKFLYLTHASERLLWGTARSQRVSRFIHEIPPKYLKTTRSAYARAPSRSYW